MNLVEKAIQGIAAALCIAWYVREREADGSAAGFLGIALLLLCPYYIVFDQGMETTLAVALLAASVQALRRDRPILLGVLLALLFLCRLDSGIFVGLPLALYAVWSGKNGVPHARGVHQMHRSLPPEGAHRSLGRPFATESSRWAIAH